MNKVKFKILAVLLIVFALKNVNAQDYNLRIGFKLPSTLNIGIENSINKSESTYYGEILLSSYPFSLNQIKFLRLYGANHYKSGVLIDPLIFGFGFEGGVNLALGNKKVLDYINLNVNVLSLPNTIINDEVINNAFDVDLNSPKYPLGFVRKEMSSLPLTLKSSFFNIGISYVYEFKKRKAENSFRLAFEIKKTFWSKHRLYSDYRFLTPIEKLTDKELNKMMLKYGWFPSINIYYLIGTKTIYRY